MRKCSSMIAIAIFALLVGGFFFSEHKDRQLAEQRRSGRPAMIAFLENYCSQIQAELEAKYKLETNDRRCKHKGQLYDTYYNIGIDDHSTLQFVIDIYTRKVRSVTFFLGPGHEMKSGNYPVPKLSSDQMLPE